MLSGEPFSSNSYLIMLSIHGFPGGGCQDRIQLIFMAVVTGLDTAPTLESHLYIKCGFFIFFLRALTLLGSRKKFFKDLPIQGYYLGVSTNCVPGTGLTFRLES